MQVADWLHVSSRVASALLAGDPVVSLVHVDAPRATSNAWPMPIAIGSLHAGATTLGRVVSGTEAREWDVPHVVGGEVITVREVLEQALHEAQHRLHDVEALLRSALAAPCPSTPPSRPAA